MMFIKKHRRLIITLITIIAIPCIILVTTLGFCIYFNSFVNCSGKVSIFKIDAVNFPKENLISYYGLSEEEAADVTGNPGNYRLIYCTCVVDNKAGLMFSNIKAQGKISENLLVGNLVIVIYDIPQLDLSRGKSEETDFDFIVRTEGKTDDEILEVIKKSKLYLTGTADDLFPIRSKWRVKLNR